MTRPRIGELSRWHRALSVMMLIGTATGNGMNESVFTSRDLMHCKSLCVYRCTCNVDGFILNT